MKCNPWVGGSIGRRGFPMLGTGKRGLSTYVKQLFSNGEQGFFYDPNDLTAEKINWRRNLLLYTQSFTNNIHIQSDASLTVGGFAPDGTTTATKVIPNAVNAAYHGVYYVIHASMQVGKVYTASVYAKAAEYGVLRLSDTANASFGMLFDLRKGTMSNDVGATKALNMTGAIEAIGNGWYRCSVQFTAIGQPPAITATRVINVSVFDAAITPYAGNGVSGLYIWGMQLEAGSLTPYQALTDFNSEFMRQFPLHALYQDAAGTVPVTAAGQPVGLILDKSKGLTLGNELVTNGTFSEGDTGWSLVSGARVAAGVLELSAQYSAAYQAHTVSNGDILELSYTVVESSGTPLLYVSSASYIDTSTALNAAVGGHKVLLRVIDATKPLRLVQNSTGSVLKLDNVSVKRVFGSHAYQATSASRPILQQTPILGNELVVSGDFATNDLTGWTRPDTAPSVTTVANQRVTLTAAAAASPATLARLRQAVSVSAGEYVVSLNVVSITATPQAGVALGNTTSGDATYGSIILNRVGKFEQKITVATGILGLAFTAGSVNGGSIVLDDISIKRLISYRTDQNYIEYDGVDDKLITNLPAPLVNATVLRAIPNAGTQVKYNQTLPMLYANATPHSGLIAIDRALTRSEQLRLMTELDKKAGATSLDTLTFKLFDSNQVGFVYDPNDLSTMYQDAAGTVPVTGEGQPVGLLLDKSKGLMLGSNLATTTSVIGTGIGGTEFKTVTVSTALETGFWYKITINVSNYSGTGEVGITGTGTAFPISIVPSGIRTRSSDGLISFIALAQTNNAVVLYTRNANNADFTNITIQKISGNHAYQTTSASRPILRKNAVTGANYLEFDGTDDFLKTNNIDFTATDKMSLFAGLNRTGNAAISSVLETGLNYSSPAGGFGILCPTQAGTSTLNLMASAGASTVYTIGTGSPDMFVYSGFIDTSKTTAIEQVNFKVNGVLVNTGRAGLAGNANFANVPIHIGRRGNASLPFNGHIYSLIGVGRLSTDDEIAAIEKELAKRTGATLNV